jgi:hypothetical protein
MHRDHRRLDHGAFVVDDLDRGERINDINDLHDIDHARKLDDIRSGFHNDRCGVDDSNSDDGRESAGDGGSESARGGGRSPR